MAIRAVQIHSVDGGGPDPIQWGKEGASETFSKGAPLIDDGSGRLTIWTADADDIVGFAAQAGANNSTEGAVDLPYYEPHSGVNFAISVSDSGAFATGACNDSDVQIAYGLAISGGIAYVDKADTSNQRVRIIRLIDDSGTVHGRAICKVLVTSTNMDDA